MPIHDLTFNGQVYDLTVPEGASPEEIQRTAQAAIQALGELQKPGGQVAVDPNGAFAAAAQPGGPGFAPGTAPGDAAGMLAGRVLNQRLPLEPGQTETTTTTELAPGERIPGPSGQRAGIGQLIGGTLGGMAGAAMSAPVPGLPLLGAPAGAYVGGNAGELIQAGIESLLGALPSRAGSAPERGDVAGTEAAKAEAIVQAIGLPAAGWSFLRSLTPEARARAYEAMVAKMAPEVRQQAERAINATSGAAQRQAQVAEDAIPRKMQLRSDKLAGPVPQPVTLQQGAPRTLGSQPGNMTTWTPPPVVRQARAPSPLRMPDIPPQVADPRRVLEGVGKEALDTKTLLQPIRDSVGDFETGRLLAQNPDAKALLLKNAQTRQERKAIEALASEPPRSTGTMRKVAGAVGAAAGTGVGGAVGQSLGGPVGAMAGAGIGAAVGAPTAMLVEAVVRRTLDSGIPPAIASSIRDVFLRPGLQYNLLESMPATRKAPTPPFPPAGGPSAVAQAKR